MVEAIEFMRDNDMLSCFELLHFHLGSQISAIRAVKNALREAGRFYVECVKLGAPLKYFDAGGGLGVDYDGSQTNFASSMNYTMQEYANDIVFGLQESCEAAGVAHPTIVTESGRAVVAHHSMLVMNILGVGEFESGKVPETLPEDANRVVRNLLDTYREVSLKNVREAYHDALEYREEALSLFALGSLSLVERVAAEGIFWAVCQKILKIVREMREVPEEFEGLERALSDTYFCNFSHVPVAARHLGHRPAVPDHAHPPADRGAHPAGGAGGHHLRLGREDRPLHRPPGREERAGAAPVRAAEEYHLGVFLIGAYQEILGDLHNLFGNTNTVHVSLARGGGYQIEHVVAGDTVTDVLKYVSYAREDLVARVRRFAELAVRANRMTLDETRSLVRMYEEGLSGYTYLERG